jgi:predicted nucleic acid-binding protein
MSKFTFDTSIVIANKLPEISGNFLLSDVVVLELIAGASDATRFKQIQQLRKLYSDSDLLITPNEDDWLMAGKILYWLEQGARKKNLGKAPPKKSGATQRMALDVLLAVSARRHKVTLVTDNWRDFNAIQYYCNFKLAGSTEFLAKIA